MEQTNEYNEIPLNSDSKTSFPVLSHESTANNMAENDRTEQLNSDGEQANSDIEQQQLTSSNTLLTESVMAKQDTPQRTAFEGEFDEPNGTGGGGTPGSGNNLKRATRTFQTLLMGSKIRHLKKKDGEPLWRLDIQYDFLVGLFTNELGVFTNSYTNEKHQTFADIYIDAMARSSKCSKILREKLLGDKRAALNMAMVCLLVNVGRMNTTLNFFPEMRAQLRTYHPIPSLQTYAKLSDYKQLQDAPRLKSILKGACEDRPEPGTIEELLLNERMPHTNPINLIFLFSTYSSKVEDRLFPQGREFFDFIMTKTLSSKSRARAFLWLVWAYLETNLEPEQLRNNPFGLGEEDGLKIPKLEILSEEEVVLENVDTEDEKEFGDAMTKLRQFYLEEGAAAAALHASVKPKRGGRVAREKTSSTSNDSPSTTKRTLNSTNSAKRNGTLNANIKREPGIGKSPARVKLTFKNLKFKNNKEGERQRKCYEQIDHILKKIYKIKRRERIMKGSIKRSWSKVQEATDPLADSDDEVANLDPKPKRGKPAVQYKGDYGEENEAIVRALRRSQRWISRWKAGDTNEDHKDENTDHGNIMKLSNLLGD